MFKIALVLPLILAPAVAHASCGKSEVISKSSAHAAEFVRETADFFGYVVRLKDRSQKDGTSQVIKVIEAGQGARQASVLVLSPYITKEGHLILGSSPNDLRVTVGTKVFVALTRDKSGRYRVPECLRLAVGRHGDAVARLLMKDRAPSS